MKSYTHKHTQSNQTHQKQQSIESVCVYLCKAIALCYPVDRSKQTQVNPNIEVFPVVKLSARVFGQPLTFYQFSLWNSRVFHRRLGYTHAVILQVIINHHRTNAEVLIWRVQHFLPKVTIETQHLEVKGYR